MKNKKVIFLELISATAARYRRLTIRIIAKREEEVEKKKKKSKKTYKLGANKRVSSSAR